MKAPPGPHVPVWRLRFLARPGPDAQSDGRPAAGAYVNAYLAGASSDELRGRARAGIEEAGWWIEALESVERLDPQALDDEAREMSPQAQQDGAVWVFHTWPPGGLDDPGPVPG